AKPPVITCPPPLVVSADKGSKGTTVNWKIPEPADNSGLRPKIFTYPEFIIPPVYLELGKTNIQYVAVDRAGHKSSCGFQIMVYGNFHFPYLAREIRERARWFSCSEIILSE
ncbi:hypothetical protein AVEN_182651-1, partial [Araneus ventricosus]